MSGRRRAAFLERGFTLAELAVVLVIVSLLIGGLLVPLSSQMAMRHVDATRRSLAEIREALLGFVAANGRLPCPAAATTPSGAAAAGIEAPRTAAGDCPFVAGVLPWATLGVSETDAWGRRYSYRVTPEFAQGVGLPAPTPLCSRPQSAAFSLCAAGDLDVLATAGGNKIASKVPVVVISHGSNGDGAYLPEGTQLPAGADSDEHDNQLTNAGTAMANVELVSKTPTPTFDDEVIWLPLGVLFNRMITVGKLP